ncbi:hypothetical protein MGG_17978 [Pyricularia oryzae 70-15]|nr:uncharacterized protein MGG_17978 [Pyricularia oryzae 70-15]EHA46277.1 hypothetical protein MGG_17978 [Pyricularia oryzae 70-15]ELQ36187.1 hypothetical protein OOU_Y34scaffold00666g48 [Pyricularia oryzae Y34]KAI7919601.1 hypothetical protein M9X92_006346 [Pyricularia oryzae]KAI7926129.1 hypothetical protein M0657_003888 [Pyricularia oryzae]
MASQDVAFDALVEGLADTVNTLDTDLKPLIENFKEISSKLPVLDQAKLNVLLAYSIESIIFSALRLEGVDAKNHDVFRELTRTRQYFDKIKKAETPPEPRPEGTGVDTQAAIRFIKADLADEKNKEMNLRLKELLAKEKAKAALKKRRAPEGAEASAETSDASVNQSDSSNAKRKKHGSSSKGPKLTK